MATGISAETIHTLNILCATFPTADVIQWMWNTFLLQFVLPTRPHSYSVRFGVITAVTNPPASVQSGTRGAQKFRRNIPSLSWISRQYVLPNRNIYLTTRCHNQLRPWRWKPMFLRTCGLPTRLHGFSNKHSAEYGDNTFLWIIIYTRLQCA
jgi:hypothetical protein